MNDEKNYVKVSVETELPDKSGEYFCIDPNGFVPNCNAVFRYDKATNGWFDGSDNYHPSHWFKPVPTTEKPSALPKCESGCKVFTGGEIKHHEDCVFYPESLTKLNADIIATQQSEIARLKAELKYRFVRFEEEQSKAESLKAELEEAESDRNLFAEWIRLNRWRNDIVTFERWEKTFSHGSEYKTTSELYDIYQSQKQKR